MYPLALCLVKVSILILYLRTFTEKGILRIVLYMVLALTMISHLIAIPLYWSQVTPFNCEWKYGTMPDDYYPYFCTVHHDTLRYWLFLAIINIFLDIIVIALPSRAV